jgi:predicted nucleotidyltransferase
MAYRDPAHARKQATSILKKTRHEGGKAQLTENADIGLPTGWREGAVAWTEKNDSVRELWLFGSRAKGDAHDGSDVDFGLVLMPAVGKHDWALGNYAELGAHWRTDLEAIVGRHVSLVPMLPGNEGDAVVRMTGYRLWQRPPVV